MTTKEISGVNPFAIKATPVNTTIDKSAPPQTHTTEKPINFGGKPEAPTDSLEIKSEQSAKQPEPVITKNDDGSTVTTYKNADGTTNKTEVKTRSGKTLSESTYSNGKLASKSTYESTYGSQYNPDIETMFYDTETGKISRSEYRRAKDIISPYSSEMVEETKKSAPTKIFYNEKEQVIKTVKPSGEYTIPNDFEKGISGGSKKYDAKGNLVSEEDNNLVTTYKDGKIDTREGYDGAFHRQIEYKDGKPFKMTSYNKSRIGGDAETYYNPDGSVKKHIISDETKERIKEMEKEIKEMKAPSNLNKIIEDIKKPKPKD